MKQVSFLNEQLDLTESANSTFPWLIFARRLVHSAYLLDSASDTGNPSKDVRNVARMCMGMAIECYFKAYYVASGKALHDGKKQTTFGSHNLAEMAGKVGFPVTLEQEKVLHYLSMWVKVKGRYPIPLNLSDMAVHPADEDTNPYTPHLLVWNDKSDEICTELVRELEALVTSEGKNHAVAE